MYKDLQNDSSASTEGHGSDRSSNKKWLFTVTPLVISFLALVVSGYVLWSNHLAPFNLNVTAGNPAMSLTESGQDGGMFSLGMFVPIDFVNEGAKGGTIKDILLRVDVQNYTWFFNACVITEEYLLAEKEIESRHYFHPFYMMGHERLHQNVLFCPVLDNEYVEFRPPEFALDHPNLITGEYILTVLVYDSEHDSFRKVGEEVYYHLKDKGLSAIMASSTFVPRPADHIEARNLYYQQVYAERNQ